MSRSTIFSLTTLGAGLVLVLLNGPAQAGWTEDFESYSEGLLTSAPWDEGSATDLGASQMIKAAHGYGGSQALVADGVSWASLGNAWRAAPASGVTQLTARLYSDNAQEAANSRYYVGFWNSPSADGAHHSDVDYMAIYLTSFAGGAATNFFSFEYSNFDPGGVFVAPVSPDDRADDNSCCSSGVSPNTWYDVRITLNGDDTATGEYRASAAGDSGAWTLIGDGGGGAAGDGTINISDPAGFSPNYVGFRGGFQARLDDISVNGVPEPSSLLLILVGLTGLALRGSRRRRNG